MSNLNIKYQFTINNTVRSHNVCIDEQSFVLKTDKTVDQPEWVQLDHCKCPNCPLAVELNPVCPASVALLPLIELCEGLNSHDLVDLMVTCEERVISQNTTVQRAISSLVGLVLPVSGCPHMAFFRPMVRFHLPLSSDIETLYRSASMYMLAQYFITKNGGDADYEMQGLRKRYEILQVINRSLAERLRSFANKDAAVNAVILLDMFARNVTYSIDETLEEIEYLFNSYLA